MPGKFGALTSEHRYQLGDTPVHLAVSMVNGAPRLSFIITRDADTGEVLVPSPLVHLATFKSEDTALAVVEFLDAMLNAVNDAVEHYEHLANKRDITHLDQLLQAEDHRNGTQN